MVIHRLGFSISLMCEQTTGPQRAQSYEGKILRFPAARH